MRVLVCGGRDFSNRSWLFNVLDDFHKELNITLIIEGGAKGADSLARDWSFGAHIPHQTYFADWETYGKAAGPIRNQRMLDYGEPDLVIAFPGGRGTADMITRAKRAGVKVQEIHDDCTT